MDILPTWIPWTLMTKSDRRLIENLAKLRPQDMSREAILRLQEMSLVGSAGRNVVSGFVVGSALIAMRMEKWIKRRILLQKLKESWKLYLVKYPAFLVTFGLVFKMLRLLGRLFVGVNQGLSKSGARHSWRRFMVTLGGFIAAFAAQGAFPIWSWEFALYAFLRSGVGIIRLIIPERYQPSGRFMFFIFNAALPFFITFNIQVVPNNYRTLFTSTQDADIEGYQFMYNREDISLPPCWPRQHKCPSCYQAFLSGFCKRLWLSMKFYSKFYAVFLLANPRQVVKAPLTSFLSLMRRSIASSFFMAGTFHFGERFHCFYRRFIRWIYRDVFQSNAPLPTNTFTARTLFLLNSGFWGWVWIGMESEGKHADLSLFTFWKEFEMSLRMAHGLTHKDEPKENTFLTHPLFSQVLFSAAISMWIWVYYRDPTRMKSADRLIVQQFLI